MPIYYALVAKQKDVVLCEYTDYSGNFQQLAMQLFSRIQPETKKTFELEDYHFHYINEEGLTVMCMTDNLIQKRTAFVFLADLRRSFYNTFSAREIEQATGHSMRFQQTIKDKIDFYNDNPNVQNDSKTESLVKELNETKDVMVENLNKILERDLKIDVVLRNSE